MTATTLSTSTVGTAGTDRTNAPASSPRRRGFNGLRRLGSPSPAETSRLSPRNYFSRSASYPQSPSTPPRPNTAESTPRPSESRSQEANESARQEGVSQDTPDLLTQITTGGTILPNEPTDSPPIHQPSTESSDMARHRPSGSMRGPVSGSTHSTEAQRSTIVEGDASIDAGNLTNVQTNGTAQDAPDEKSRPPTIRFFPHQELRQGRPSLTFAPVIRTLPSESSIIRVGRYSEREGVPVSNPTGPSEAPVGFKSKVVSRKHCEFSYVNGSWQIKDVSSSSGTFLNHIRLSQPNTESRLYPVKDGDIVQLGIDFRGGEEMIFRCVKIRIECNRAWQKRPNNFK
jgi:E3 ubiquitin-protein ligase DMA1/2